jgi:S1-C subfamily serine protease
VHFQEKDVSQDRAAAMEMIRRSGQVGVPVITVDDQVIVGFDRQRLEQVLARGRSPRPVLGAQVTSAEAIARKRGLDLPAGAYVGQVTAGSAADRAGLREGDVILTLNRQPVRSADDVERALRALAPGEQKADITWWHDGHEVRGEVVLP